MKRSRHNYFKEDIRRILLMHAVVPVALLTLVCLGIIRGTLTYQTEKTNRDDNSVMVNDVETTISSYMQLAEELATSRISSSGRWMLKPGQKSLKAFTALQICLTEGLHCMCWIKI